ncbi:MAG: hypothetical protein DI623_05740 [Sphingomonas sanxanigenens]|uniref:ORC1/DEAH AAA+ ATPase domain-containing protein n=1 Tax=Sphingomonas sanxanigenens TaxID=397260 RepID=A0A2W5A8Y9_9SPHN|nr:MAG: hypothetical protein DI623_05740 [Sphingomonas sanxanigenens]
MDRRLDIGQGIMGIGVVEAICRRELIEFEDGLALCADRHRQAARRDLPASIPPAVLEALLRSTAVHTAYSRFWISYEELKTPLLQAADGPDERKIATDLLLFAGAIRPAIVQSTAALSVIDALDGEVAAWLQPLRTVIADVAQSHLAGIAEIAAPADLELQRQRLEDVRKRLEEWRDAAPARKTNYQPATLVWNHLISADGPIGKSISAALASDEKATAQIQEWVADLDDDSDQAIDDAHTTVSRGIRKDAIEGNARKQLRGLIGSATELLGEWIDIQSVQGAREDRFRLNRDRLLSVMADAQPYADKETAIENFFGRENELDTLLDPYGASFVYGGRQLGKTALLRQIELRQRDSPDRVAVYCYIKPVGESLSADSVWDKIRAALVDRGLALVKSGLVPDQLQSWVQDKPGRYLLIMLDEADAFLESEMANNFPQIERMKALMAGTGRSIKFVFAGLHNVQRFYRAPNSPLVHLGAPVNVGPLLGTDRRAARQMALEPMAALGFTFKDTIDAYHMLSLIGF